MSESKKTLILGASEKPHRYSNMAAKRLTGNGHEIVQLGLRDGKAAGEPIMAGKPDLKGKDIDTVTLYLGPQNQPEWYDYIIGIKPKRIIFNPGTENIELERLADDAGIESVYGCTLVMLGAGTY